ncbi:MAG TPA: FtsK/SpoIIIE domain-containing protein [Microbacterium sp.]|nr:FtsK/SpoIIIE domain-containing protein [Microbacterium sp.]
MKLRLSLLRPQGTTDDITIAADGTATLAEVAATIVRADPLRDRTAAELGEVTLEAFSSIAAGPGEVLDAASTLAHVDLAAGATVRVVPASYEPRPTIGRLEILSGPDAGRSLPLSRGALTIGRDAGCDIVLDDPLVSKRHARLEVGGDRVELIDLNSANGIVVEGASVTRLVADGGRLAAVLGDTRIRVTTDAMPQALAAGPGAATSVRQVDFIRSPRVEERYNGEELPGTDLPTPPQKPPFPWLALLAPLLMGPILFLVTGNITTLLFVALSPILMIGTWATAKMTNRRQSAEEKERFEQQLGRLGDRLARERDREISVRRREVPELADLSADALAAGPLVWTRRLEHWSFLHLRLGAGETASRNSVAESAQRDRAIPEYVTRLDELVDSYKTVADVPILEALPDAGALGVSGGIAQAAPYARSLVAQLAGLHAPGDVVIAGLWGNRWGGEFANAKWLPHAWAAESLLGTTPIADNPAAAQRLVAQLEELIESRAPKGAAAAGAVALGALSTDEAATRSGAKVGERNAPDADKTARPAVIVLIAADAPADLGRLIQISERAAGRGIHPIWLAESPSNLPASCRTFVDLGAADPSAHFVRLGDVVSPLAVEGLSGDQFSVFCRALARLTDAGEVESSQSDVPRTVPLLHLLGRDMATNPDSIVDRWTQNDSLHSKRSGGASKGYQPKLRALVGQGAHGAMQLDLRQQGPHALVGGTTGSGKSEFLQAWVLGMAAEYSPDRVTFLFVDYKGGSAFADCIKLPHCVGLVTDLNPHLVRRVLVSLRAELHHRERLFNRKKAKDILELERSGDPQAPPALVLVIDEFAALAKEVPEFVDGVVDIAQRGRSLGIHLIMATQRPAGVIKDNLRANTNLRVALRMADETDSDDVIGSKDAALFDPGLPGRGIAKTGPGRTTLFQSAYAGGWSLREADEVEIDIEPFGSNGLPWAVPVIEAAPENEDELGPTDQQLLVARMVEAAVAATVVQPRRPWLDELAPTFDQTKLPQRTDAALLLGVLDVPEHQEQSPFHFAPDDEGHLAIFGTSGSGKSVTLRTLAVSAGITPRGGPVHVYGLDFSSGGLRMLEPLPHVGSVIQGDDSERVQRLFAMLRSELERRGDAYSEAGASTLPEYRSLAGRPDEPRILLLIDGYPTFRNDWEGVPGRADTYRALQQVLSDGRSAGIHVALTADRGQSVPSALNAMIQRRIVLRMTDPDAYSLLDVPRDILSPSSVPGRAIVADCEAQIAVIGGTRSTKEQSLAIERMAASMSRRGFAPAPAVRSLPTLFEATELPDRVGDLVAVGIADTDLGPLGIEPFGTFIVAGPPASGRSNALAAVAAQALRNRPGTHTLFIGSTRSPAASAIAWGETASDASSGMMALSKVEEEMDAGRIPIVALEGIGEWANSLLEIKLSDLIRRAGRGDALLIVEGELSSWTSNFGLLGEIKSARRGVVLQPETLDGETVLKSAFPRLVRGEFPVGRGILTQRGKLARVHFPLLVEERV